MARLLESEGDTMNQRLDGDADALARVLAAVPEVVVVVDLEGTILYLNRVEKGYDREQVLGIHASAIMPPESQAIFSAALDSVRRTGTTEEFEVEAVSPSGDRQWFRSRMAPIWNDGAVVAALIIAADISELKVAQAEVKRLRRLLPICSWCDRIHSENGAWISIEAHLERESGTRVSHGLCPDCHQKQLDSDLEGSGGDGHVA